MVLLGGTGGVGRALARLLAERGDSLFLLGRNLEELERSRSDLCARGGDVQGVACCDLLRAETIPSALDDAWSRLGKVDAVVTTAGVFDSQDAYEADPDACETMLTVNFVRTVRFCEEARRRLLAGGGGRLCVFASIAGDRARRPVALYGASKAGLAHYAQGLDVAYRRRGLRTTLVKPGFLRTAMTAGLPEPPLASGPEVAARRVVRALDRGWPVVYAPAVWRWVSLGVRMLPRAVLERVQF